MIPDATLRKMEETAWDAAERGVAVRATMVLDLLAALREARAENERLRTTLKTSLACLDTYAQMGPVVPSALVALLESLRSDLRTALSRDAGREG